jgi:hypothetical protein
VLRTYAVTHRVDLENHKEKQMGRPLYKDVNGDKVIGTGAGATTGIRVDFYDGSTLQTDGIIIKQRGAKTFVVARVGTPTTTFTCRLVDTAPNAAGEMRMMGYPGGNANNPVAISKITRRIATGFPSSPVLASGNWPAETSNATTNHDQVRYTWYLENDSSADIIVLTQITAVL